MDEESLIARAKEEREKIFQRYDKGRAADAEIDPWEDPQFEVYHQTDRYGFIHDKRLPRKRDPHETKATEIEMERVKKWVKMLGISSEKQAPSWEDRALRAKVRKRVFKGIPEKLRRQAWSKLLNLKEVMDGNPGKYNDMLLLARQWSTEARQIDSDVNRQFREHLDFRERYSPKQKSLFNILVAYSVYNTEVGYCQGMSALAGLLLMYMEEEEAFWALSILLANKKYAMHGLFIEGFPKLNRFLAHHDKIIAKFIPKLKKHFDQYNLDSILYSLKWFFLVFIERIPFSLCLRVWDVYLLDGEKVVTAMAYNVLRLHKHRILKLKDMDLIVQYIQTKLYEDFGYDDDLVIKGLEQCMEELRKAGLELPPPPTAKELPTKQFGIFVEPSTEAKIGRRKQEFTETEKNVTETVKLKREITEQEIAAHEQNATTSGGSAQHLNTVHIPESEDGGSLIGSSRKSLADTSVTSTADLSVLSGGQSQRSHQAFELGPEDQKAIVSEDDEPDDGESSPVSAIGSTSVVERSPSALQMTPRAMSPQDVVRIYVPPAPPDELRTVETQRRNGERAPIGQPPHSTARDHRSSRGHENNDEDEEEDDAESKTRRNSEIDLYLQQSTIGTASLISAASAGTSHAAAAAGGRYSIDYASGEFQGPASASNNAATTSTGQHYASNGRSSSSSRRGSMSRKSPAPMLDSEFIIECSHVKNRKYVPDHHSSHNSLVLIGGPGGTSRNGSESNIQRMTSFEELAKAKLQQHLSGSGGGSSSSLRRLTSEEHYRRSTAKGGAGPSVGSSRKIMARSEVYDTIDDGDMMPPDSSIHSTKSAAYRGHKSDYNIRYHNMASSPTAGPTSPFSDGAGDGEATTEWSSSGGGGVRGADGENRAYKANPSRQHSDSSPFDYDPLTTAASVPSKRYNRFFNNDDDDDEDEDDEEEIGSNADSSRQITSKSVSEKTNTGRIAHSYRPYERRNEEEEDKLLGKSSDDSSTSPPPSAPIGSSRPSQLPQYHRGAAAAVTGSQPRSQQQRPRQRQPPHHNGDIISTPTNDTIPLLPVSPTELSSPGSTISSHRTYAGSTVSGSAIPVSSVKRKSSTDGTSSTHRRQGSSSASGKLPHSAVPSSPPQPSAAGGNLSRIPVGMRSPTSPTGSFRIVSPKVNSQSRIPRGSEQPPASEIHSPTGFGGTASYASRLGSSRSAQQIHSDANKIRIQINPSQSYTSG
ncbi:uncharacterized protein LOC126572741 isoform X2 [Anopheles aquasalis]|uniref:uncharacterized protein LOC126572741 isoform X2 n=1 Tax=Anopheles aquasalis TaxID=42839 RepID=UPI00215AE489|nr:uncharacterized protein LOC126572741 isoform X2 [Anopheles aquasalis]